MVLLSLLASTPGAYAETMPPLSDLAGHTLFGATVESGAVWSVYLAHDGHAAFSYASGETGAARWRAADAGVICFAFDTSGDETCKRGSDYGIGSGWSTVHPREDGEWRPYQEDPHGSSRIFAAWPGRYDHNPASFTGDLRDSLPGRLYFDDPGTGVFAVEVHPDGTGAVLSAKGHHQIEETEYGARHVCIDEECAEVRIEGGRLRLYKRGNDRSEGNLIYLALGRFTSPSELEQKETPEPVVSVEVAADTPSTVVAPDEERCFDFFGGGGTPECQAAREKAISDAIASATANAAVANTATSDAARTTGNEPEVTKYDVEYPWFGRYHDIPTRHVKSWDQGEPVRVDFENGSPRIGGRVLVPGFEAIAVRIVAVTDSFALIRFSGPMLPDGCAEAFRWLWVTEVEYGLMSQPFGACTKTDDIEVTWKGARIVTTITPESGVPSTFEIFPARSDDQSRMKVSVAAGPAIEFAPLKEEDWKAIERREEMARLAADEQQKSEERRQAEKQAAQRRAAEVEAKRQPAKPTGRLDEGNVFDILAENAVQSELMASENGKGLRDVFKQNFTIATYLPENRRVGDVYLGLGCGPDGCRELQVLALYDAVTGSAFGAVIAGLSTSITFGSEEWIDQDVVAPVLQAMMEDMAATWADEIVSDYTE